ncbi:hypothetical protein MD484_g3872, partial [Candolleomyces efflorescens]
MAYTSPWLNPGPYSSTVDRLSAEAIAIDEGVYQTVLNAQNFSEKYSGDFSIVTQLKDETSQFNSKWSQELQTSRDAASALSGWLRSFSGVYLAMINDVVTENDAHDLVTEYNAFLKAPYPSAKYPLDDTPGPKKAFNEIEGLAVTEANHVITSVQGNDWQNGLKDLKKDLPAAMQGVTQVRNALNSYATKLE